MNAQMHFLNCYRSKRDGRMAHKNNVRQTTHFCCCLYFDLLALSQILIYRIIAFRMMLRKI